MFLREWEGIVNGPGEADVGIAVYEFRNAREIVRTLRKERASLADWFNQREESLEQIITESVGRNTFRAFRRLPRQPSAVFRKWAESALADRKSVAKLTSLRSQVAYDVWLDEFSCSLRREWQEQMGVVLPFGASRKLPDLLLKHLMWWSSLSDRQRCRLITFLHVPLDSSTLVGIRRCIDDPEIPANATMGFVAGRTMYRQIQEAIRTITKQAGVPDIYFDVLAWNMSRGASV